MSPLIVIAPVFLAIALVYSAVGLGGGSAYLAALALSEVPHSQIPAIALSLNVLASGSSWLRFSRAGHFQSRLLLPLVGCSIPAAFIGSIVKVTEKSFHTWVGIVLFITGICVLLLREVRPSNIVLSSIQRHAVALAIGAVLGFVAGLLGIGGGIFLGPVLLLIRWTNAKQTAAITSAFVCLNSVSGLSVHLLQGIPDLALWLPLIGVVLVGSQLGSYAGTNVLSTRLLQKILGVVLLLASTLIMVRNS